MRGLGEWSLDLGDGYVRLNIGETTYSRVENV